MSIGTTPSLTFSNAIPLPRGVFAEGGPTTVRNFDMMRDGQLLAVVPAGEEESERRPTPQIYVVLNWFDELNQRVPVK